jgi:hypothetical protein
MAKQPPPPANFSPTDILDAFKKSVDILGYLNPLEQAEVKPVTAITVDLLAGGMVGIKARPPSPDAPDALTISLSGKNTRHVINSKLKFTHLDPFESMLDISVYSGQADPYDTLITAESEAYRDHHIDKTSRSDDSDYLWDLFKLLQVWSPVRLFVARVGERRGSPPRQRLELVKTRVEALVQGYCRKQIPRGAALLGQGHKAAFCG